jgi:hypothetical protein
MSDQIKHTGPRPMTRAEIEALPALPPRFTGLWRGTYYYRGAVWMGPRNTIGRRDLGARP